jgi:hypothetical protein
MFFSERMDRKTQRDRILALLIAAHGQWVELPEIMRLAAQYNARLWELRHLGFNIENKIRDVGGVRHSWFRLCAAPERLAIPRPGAKKGSNLPDAGDSIRPAVLDRRPAIAQGKSTGASSGRAVQQPLFADRHFDD